MVSWKDRKALMPALKAIYRAEAALDTFQASHWAKRYPMIAPMWRRVWAYVVPFFAFPPAIRKMIDTTNAVESLNRSLRKVIKTRGSFLSDEAALKPLYMAIQHAGLRWKPAIAWPEAKLQFMILFGGRITRSASRPSNTDHRHGAVHTEDRTLPEASFAPSTVWRFLDRHNLTYKKNGARQWPPIE
jgi:putative transposase